MTSPHKAAHLTARPGHFWSGPTASTIVVRIPDQSWPGEGLGEMLGDRYLVTSSVDIHAHVVLLDGADAATVRGLRQTYPAVRIMIRTEADQVVGALQTGADVVVTDPSHAELAARIAALCRQL